MVDCKEAAAYVAGLVKRAGKAQRQIEFLSQEQVDELSTRLAWAGCEPVFASKISNFAAEESGMGIPSDKYAKIMAKVKGALYDMRGEKSVGLVENNKERGILKYAKPMGVVGALVPCTNPEATPFVKAISAIKTRNAIIFSPHPRTKGTNKMAVDQMRKTLKKAGYPEDLVIGIEEVSVEASTELMRQSDVVLATGGGAMVHAAYSSGTPAFGVGAGNAATIIDETADLADAANKIKRSKTFDNATSCSTENSAIIQADVYDAMLKALEAEGAYIANDEEKKALETVMWEDGHLNRHIVAQPVQKIAAMAEIKLEDDRAFICVCESGIGADFPFSGEKLSLVTALYKYDKFEDAVRMINDITTYSGAGHSCGIHTFDDRRVKELGRRVKVSRIMVRQPQCLANSGAWTNGMPMSMTLGCGTWGGNAASENITWKNLLNYTYVSYETADHRPSDEELFGTIMKGEKV